MNGVKVSKRKETDSPSYAHVPSKKPNLNLKMTAKKCTELYNARASDCCRCHPRCLNSLVFQLPATQSLNMLGGPLMCKIGHIEVTLKQTNQ